MVENLSEVSKLPVHFRELLEGLGKMDAVVLGRRRGGLDDCEEHSVVRAACGRRLN